MSNKDKDLGSYLSPKELEEKLGIAYSSQFKMRREGLIPYTKLGGKIMYNKSEIIKWLENNSHKVMS